MRRNYGLAQNMLWQAIACRDMDCLVWPYTRSGGRGYIKLKGKMRIVSALVCEELHGPRPSPLHQASHLCRNGAGGCVNGSHIVWETRAQNHARERGFMPTRKVSSNDIPIIRSMIASGYTQKRIAMKYGVKRQAISKIANRERWGWLGALT